MIEALLQHYSFREPLPPGPQPNLAHHATSPCCSVGQSCLTLYSPMNRSMPGFLVLHSLLEFAQTQVCWVGYAMQPSHPLLPPSPPAFNLLQHQGLFPWVSSLHQVAKVLAFQHQSFQWIFRVNFLLLFIIFKSFIVWNYVVCLLIYCLTPSSDWKFHKKIIWDWIPRARYISQKIVSFQEVFWKWIQWSPPCISC